MKNLFFKLFLGIFACIIMPSQIFAQLPPNDPNYKMVFHDEFDTQSLDTMWSRTDWHIGLWKFLLDGNCLEFVDQRTLSANNLLLDTIGTGKITLRERRFDTLVYVYNECNNTHVWHNFNYTSPAVLESKERFKYGYFEIRCKIPYIDTSLYSTKGIGPNFWLFSSTGGYHTWSEIDGFEYYNFYTDSVPKWGSATHYRECDPPGDGTCDITLHNDPPSIYIPNNTGTYHLYAIKWDPDKIEFYYDNQLISTSYNHPSEMYPQAVILDINVFFNSPPIASTLFPFDYDIDYVRVYQMKQYCDSTLTLCSFNPLTFDYSLYKEIVIGDGSCSVTISSATPINLISTDGYTLNPGAEIQVGTEINFGIDVCQPATNIKSNEHYLPVLKASEYYKNQ